MSKTFLVELSKVSRGNLLTKNISSSELDRARFIACRGLEDLGYSVDNYIDQGVTTPEEEQLISFIQASFEDFSLGVPTDIKVKIVDKPNGFLFKFLF